jgi:hypothetical protein
MGAQAVKGGEVEAHGDSLSNELPVVQDSMARPAEGRILAENAFGMEASIADLGCYQSIRCVLFAYC